HWLRSTRASVCMSGASNERDHHRRRLAGPRQSRPPNRRRRAVAALHLARAVRPLFGRRHDGGAGAVLPRLAMAADVVALSPASRGGLLGGAAAGVLRDYPVLRISRALRARQPPH